MCKIGKQCLSEFTKSFKVRLTSQGCSKIVDSELLIFICKLYLAGLKYDSNEPLVPLFTGFPKFHFSTELTWPVIFRSAADGPI